MRDTANPTYLDKFHQAQWDARAAVSVVTDVACVIRRFGSPLADELDDAAALLEEAHKAMSAAVSEDLTRQVKTAHGHIAEVFLAALKVTSNEGEVSR